MTRLRSTCCGAFLLNQIFTHVHRKPFKVGPMTAGLIPRQLMVQNLKLSIIFCSVCVQVLMKTVRSPKSPKLFLCQLAGLKVTASCEFEKIVKLLFVPHRDQTKASGVAACGLSRLLSGQPPHSSH